MDALDLILFGRQLAKIGEEALRGTRSPAAPTGQALVLRDVFANPASSITDIASRTGLPQGYVSESVARLRDRGIVQTHPDPADRRRTLARVSDSHARSTARKAAVSVDGALAEAFGDRQSVRKLEALATRLRPVDSGPILTRLEQKGEG